MRGENDAFGIGQWGKILVTMKWRKNPLIQIQGMLLDSNDEENSYIYMLQNDHTAKWNDLTLEPCPKIQLGSWQG